MFSPMAVTTGKIKKNLQRIHDGITEACNRSGRNPDEVMIIAVTKSVDFATVKNALDAGLTNLGENRATQLVERMTQMRAYLQRRRNASPGDVTWHMVGHVQRNKVKAVLDGADVIHSVDSLRLAEEIGSRAERMETNPRVLLQVNCSQEAQKFGVAVGAAMHLAESICTMKNIRVIGLMTMAPLSSDPEVVRPTFTRLRELFEEMHKDEIGGDEFRHLSMGMSQDYTIAVEEGATLLRIGTALFE